MKLFSKLVELFLHFIIWIWKKTGINGVLVIAFCIELLLIIPICSELESHQEIAKNYQCNLAGEPVFVDTHSLSEEQKKYATDNESYYKITLMVENHSSMDLGYLSVQISDQNENPLPYEQDNYYDSNAQDSNFCRRNTIPAGAYGHVSYYVGLPSYAMENITAVHIYPDNHLITTKKSSSAIEVPLKKKSGK